MYLCNWNRITLTLFAMSPKYGDLDTVITVQLQKYNILTSCKRWAETYTINL